MITRTLVSTLSFTGFRLLAVSAVLNSVLCAQTPNLESNIARPLRYHPEGTDFVIENGGEFFNRPLYGTHTAFRVDAGDKPEFALYLPGRGGNLRVALKRGGSAKWLFDAAHITTRYRPGSMIYEIRDPLLGDHATLRLTAIPTQEIQGLILRVELQGNADGVELVYVYGGVNGEKGDRNGDIGCEKLPVSQFFQFKPQLCKDNEITVENGAFTLRSKPATISGRLSSSSPKTTLADGENWNALPKLLSTTGQPAPKFPVVVTEAPLKPGEPMFFALLRTGETTTSDLPQLFEKAERNRQQIAGKIVVDTPDPFINAAASALCIAADSVWDTTQNAFMHGAVAWRNKLLGWRGGYSGDELGWHERTRGHLMNWLPKQNTQPVPSSQSGEPAPVPPDDSDKARLARNEPALHSNGDLSNSHYDMNLLAVDLLFRHLLWTGDVDYARNVWPVIERHLAWERRLFRREVGPDKLPLYEAYCCIWASDSLFYNGGGATHSSALNAYHNRMAARVAKLLGKDPKPYEREADLIAKAMRQNLWLHNEGIFAESKDLLGRQALHPNPALWTFYHTVDSEVPTPLEAWQMSRYVNTQMVHIPIQGDNVPDENLYTMPTTNWMPYTWSTNNVVMAESTHTALALWQAGSSDSALRLFKGSLLDSMFMGLSPGNVGMCTQFDIARREAQRDFADGIGATSRALIEGLFGIKPDALAGELVVRPHFPAKWDHASLQHPDFVFEYKRDGVTETFSIEPKFPKPMSLRLVIPARRESIERVSADGQVKTRWLDHQVGAPLVEVVCSSQKKYVITITWKGDKVPAIKDPTSPMQVVHAANAPAVNWKKPAPSSTQWVTVDLTPIFNDKVTQIFKNEYLSPRSPFCSLAVPKQGFGNWCHPSDLFEVDDSGLRAVADQNHGRIVLPNGAPLQTPGPGDTKNIVFTSQWDNYPHEVTVALSGNASHAYLLMAGSTDSMQSQFDNGEVIVTYSDGSTERLALRNPTNWWPIDQDYFMDDYAFRRPEPIPPRVDLKTGKIRILDVAEFKGKGRTVAGGAATVLDLPLNQSKKLKSLTVRALANEVVIGLMSATLER